MRAPVVSRKHIVQHTQFVVTSATVTTFDDAHAVSIQNVNANFEVVEGSVIKAIYVEMWLTSNTGVEPAGSLVMIVEKAQSGASDPTITNMTTLDNYTNKKNVLYTTQGLVGSNTANPIPFLRQWIKIPKGKQRFGLQDKIRVSIAAIGSEDVNGCGLVIYKSYT